MKDEQQGGDVNSDKRGLPDKQVPPWMTPAHMAGFAIQAKQKMVGGQPGTFGKEMPQDRAKTAQGSDIPRDSEDVHGKGNAERKTDEKKKEVR